MGLTILRQRPAPRIYEGVPRQGRGEQKKQLPQSPPYGGDSPLFKAGAKSAPLRGARAVRPAGVNSPINRNLQSRADGFGVFLGQQKVTYNRIGHQKPLGCQPVAALSVMLGQMVLTGQIQNFRQRLKGQ